jgi:hypothetical protein
MLGPLIGEMLGVEKTPIAYSEGGCGHHVRIGDPVDVGVEDFVAVDGHDPVQLTNVFHPSNTRLTVAPAHGVRLSTFGIEWGARGKAAFPRRSTGPGERLPGLGWPRPAEREAALLLILAAAAGLQPLP